MSRDIDIMMFLQDLCPKFLVVGDSQPVVPFEIDFIILQFKVLCKCQLFFRCCIRMLQRFPDVTKVLILQVFVLQVVVQLCGECGNGSKVRLS